MVTDPQRFRVALALTILKHKPRVSSITNYVSELQCRFPIAHADPELSEEGWKRRALELETGMEDLRRRADEDAAEICNLKSELAQKAGKNGQKIASKKRKDGTESAIMDRAKRPNTGLNGQLQTSALSQDTLVYASYLKLQRLTEQSAALGNTVKTSAHLVSSATRVIHSVSCSLLDEINKGCSIRSVKNSRELDNMLKSSLTCLSEILLSPGLKAHQLADAMDITFNCLSQDLAAPLTRSFYRLALEALKQCLPLDEGAYTRSGGASLHSICSDLIGLLQHLLKSMHDVAHGREKSRFTQHYFLPLIDVIRQTALVEIQKLLPEAPSRGILDREKPVIYKRRKVTTQQRRVRLARKETLCYLCAVIRLTLSPGIRQVEDRSTSDTPFVNISLDKVQDSLTTILARCSYDDENKDSSALNLLDDVERGMLMAVVKSFWNYGVQ